MSVAGDDGEPWLYLDDPEPDPVPEPAVEEDTVADVPPDEEEGTEVPTEAPDVAEPPETEADVIAELVADGVHSFGWPLRGMDCPDCAMKAARAVNRQAGVVECQISPSDGWVKVELDLGAANLSRTSGILASLGHNPDVPWYQLKGVSQIGLQDRHGVERGALKRLLLTAPGVLHVRFEAERLLLQHAELSAEMHAEMEQALERMTGRSPILVEIQPDRLESDQLRLLGAAITVPLLLLVLFLQFTGAPAFLVTTVGILGVVLGGWRMFFEAVASLRNLVLGFQVLTSLAVIGAAVLGHWPEALTVVLLEALSGHLESSALVQARRAMQGGLDRLPRLARVLPSPKGRKSSTTSISSPSQGTSLTMAAPAAAAHGSEEVPIELVQVGDLVEVRSGELVPVDGEIVEGIGSLDRAPLTGESIPVRVTVGDEIEAGLVLRRGPVVMRTSAVGDQTRLSGLIDKVHTFRDTTPRLQGAVELFTLVWVPVVLVGGALAALLMGNVMVMLLLWVVACPCALLLAAPVPHAMALTNAAHNGLVARGGDVLERVARIDLALLDKTGTLTRGEPKLVEVISAPGQRRERILRLAAGIEERSNHAYAATVRQRAAEESLKPMKVTGISDEQAGVSGRLKAKQVRFGRDDWIVSLGIEVPELLEAAALEARVAGRGLSLLTEDDTAIALFVFEHDDLRDGADEMVAELRRQGIAVELLSGDSQSAVEALGERLGIAADSCRGEISPEGKAIWVQRRSHARRTLMAGDGFNDAAALAAADVGVAVGSGEQVNLDAADVLIPSEDPRQLSNLVRLSRRTRMIVLANILLSFLVTVTLVVSVLDGWHASLALGVFVHEASALLVLLNGIWLADAGMSRLGMLGGLFVSLWNDAREAFGKLWHQGLASIR